MTNPRFPIRLVALVAAGALTLAACGDDDDTSSATTAEAAATTTAGDTATTAGDTATTAGDTATTAGDTATTAATGGAALVTTASSSLGDILVGEGGLTVYGFMPDEASGAPTCLGACASNWPPVTVASDALPDGLDASVFSVVANPDGGFQLRAGEYPLYYFAGDSAAGDVNGQGVNDVWFVVDPTGELVTG